MKCFMGREHKKGDTLIEVSLAIGIFSMVAIAAISVINGSANGAQSALESTITREEIDGQAEALRFIQSAYVAGGQVKNDSFSKYANLWHKISDRAIDVSDLSSDEQDAILKYNPVSCSDIYNGTGWNTLAQQNAFLINTRAMGSSDWDNIVVEYNSSIFTEASTYPRIVYNDITTDELYDDPASTNYKITHAEGLYIVAVRDAGGTGIVADSGEVKTKSAYIDFYIRSCWFPPSAERASTISTAIRLYDPDALDLNKYKEKGVLIVYYANAEGIADGITTQFISAGDSQPLLNGDNIFPRSSRRFESWNRKADGSGENYPAGSSYSVPANLAASESFSLYAQWEEPSLLTYDANGDGVTGVPAPQECYLSKEDDHCYISPDSPSRPGYEFMGWASSPSATSVEYKAGDEIKFNKTKTVYAVWHYVYTITYYDTNGSTEIYFETLTDAAKTHPFQIRPIVPPSTPPVSQTGNKMEFLGWSENKNGSGTLYSSTGENKTVVATGGTHADIKLYPVWRETITFTNVTWNNFGGGASSGCTINKTNSYIELRGSRTNAVNCGVSFGVGRNDNFELSADLTTSGIFTHPTGLVAVAVGPLVAIIANNGGLTISYGYLPLNKSVTASDISSASNYTRLKQVKITGSTVAKLKLTKYGNVYTMSVNGNEAKIETRDNGNGTYNVYNSNGAVLDSNRNVSELNSLKVKYTMIHTSHNCSTIFNAKLYNIRMTKSDIYYDE